MYETVPDCTARPINLIQMLCIKSKDIGWTGIKIHFWLILSKSESGRCFVSESHKSVSLGPQKGLLLQMLERIPKGGSLKCSVEPVVVYNRNG